MYHDRLGAILEEKWGKILGQKKKSSENVLLWEDFSEVENLYIKGYSFWRDLAGCLHWASVGYVEMCGGNLG